MIEFHIIFTHHTNVLSFAGGFIVSLVLIIMIEFRDRGIFFGYPTPQQLRGKQHSVWLSPVYLIRKYHGYFIYWATITTFWYHPMENTLGHAFGFAHTWFMMLQGHSVPKFIKNVSNAKSEIIEITKSDYGNSFYLMHACYLAMRFPDTNLK